MKLRVYIDTSVIGGYFDEEFEHVSKALFRMVEKGKIIAVISDLTLLELAEAPAEIGKVIEDLPEENVEWTELTEEAVNLAWAYVREGVVGKEQFVDAEHVAIATVNRVDVLVSWNFKHIVNLGKIRGFNAVNLRLGYPLLEIRSPWEVVPLEEEED